MNCPAIVRLSYLILNVCFHNVSEDRKMNSRTLQSKKNRFISPPSPSIYEFTDVNGQLTMGEVTVSVVRVFVIGEGEKLKKWIMQFSEKVLGCCL